MMRFPIRTATCRWAVLRVLSALAVCLLVPSPRVWAQPAFQPPRPQAVAARAPAEYRSRWFQVHTDLPADEAEALLVRLERTLDVASGYWRRAPRQPIQCYVVDDLANWPQRSLPHPAAHLIVAGIGGAIVEPERPNARGSREGTIVYASSRPGIAEHEAVHAYCSQTFGKMGPSWYNEGMAELAYFEFDVEVRCSPEGIAFLRQPERPPLRGLVNAEQSFQRNSAQILQLISRKQEMTAPGQQITMKHWTDEDQRQVQSVRESYIYGWALCHLLYHNPNYAQRFRGMGRELLSHSDMTFERAFHGMTEEIAFEYQFFLDRIEPGYRVDLCAWQWRPAAGVRETDRGVRMRVNSARGYQSAGLTVSRSHRYHVQSEGTWQLSPESRAITAAGDARGQGRLEAVVMNGYQLSEPVPVAADGTFVAPSDGTLYLRCLDAWHAISDNRGTLTVTISR